MIPKKDEKRKNLLYVLSMPSLYTVTAYYLVILVFGVSVVAYYMSNLSNALNKNLMLVTTIASISISNMLCSVQYLKLLYKACLDNRIICPESGQKIIQFGNILYFILRPIYAAVFVIVAIIAVLSGFIVLSSSIDYIINDRFFYLCLLISSFIGYSIGNVLDKFESLSIKKVNEIFKKEEP